MKKLNEEHLTVFGDIDGSKTYDMEVEARNTHPSDVWRYHMEKLQWRKERIDAIMKRRDSTAQAVKKAKTLTEKLTILGNFYDIAPRMLPVDYKISDLALVFPPSHLISRLPLKIRD